MNFKVATEFYKRPLGRYRTQGTYTGEAFREDHLVRLLKELKANDKLTLDFSGVTMNGSSFLEEAFGGLIREHKYSKEYLESVLELSFPRRPSLEQKVWQYISDAELEN